MKLEHIALNVPDAASMAKWYAENLGMKIVKSMDKAPYIHFIADDAGSMIEIYSNDNAEVPDYKAISVFTLHLAFTSEDILAQRSELEAAGATIEGELNDKLIPGTSMQFLRDPWGICIQLVKRDKPLI